MIIFLYGPDTYRCQQKQKEIINEYKRKHSHLTLNKFNLENDDETQKFKEFIKTPSLFDVFKLAIVDNFFAADIKDLIKKYLDNKEVVLLLLAKPKPIKELLFLLKKPVLSQEFENLTSKQFGDFLLNEAKKRGLNFNKKVASDLSNQFQGDLWGLVTELDRIALTSNFQHSLPARYDFFSLVSKLARGNLATRLSALEVLLNREDPAKTFNVLVSLTNRKQMLANYDLAIKSGRLDYEAALTDLAIR